MTMERVVPHAASPSTQEEHQSAVYGLADDMLHKMRINDHKGHWRMMGSVELLGLLVREVKELEDALDSGEPRDVQLECADIANFAAMIHDNTKRLVMKEEEMGLEEKAGWSPFPTFPEKKEVDVPKQPKSFEQAIDWAYKGMREIMVEKRRMRGPGNIQQQGLAGIINRMGSDKLSRVMNEVERRNARAVMQKYGIPKDIINKHVPVLESVDSLEDDLFDIGNYAVIAILVERGWWSLPMEG